MRPKTVIEKIFQTHSKEEIKPGNIVWIDLDLVTARDFGGPNVVKNYREYYKEEPVFDSKKVMFTFDLTVPPKTIQYANNQQICRVFAREQGIKVFDVDAGIGTHTLIEKGHAVPGSIVVGTDSHMNILGAVNCFGQGMGDVDIAFAYRYGRTWFEVPETVKVVIKGEPKEKFTAKDLTLKILSVLKTDNLLGKAVEFYGEHVEALELAGRFTLLSMITEMAGIVGFIPFNEETVSQIRERNNMENIPEEVRADKDAEYGNVVEIDISDIGAMVAEPPFPHNVKRIDRLERVRIDFGFIGSCTNGRFKDLEAAWKVLKGKHIAEDVRLAIVPATKRVYTEAMEKGILRDLLEAGAMISNPGCGGCAQGHIGMAGKGENMVSTGNRNFLGKQGDGNNYLASPEVVAYSVLNGYLSYSEEG
ncbi:MAG: 3-isopropylmalate dehydratase/homoaconitate hydratase family large subunit [bacterium]|nr:3-isopropylmalate dehydratase/homoaconitate hydratase family large subunit [bacterium]